jgi:hypothetical protein
MRSPIAGMRPVGIVGVDCEADPFGAEIGDARVIIGGRLDQHPRLLGIGGLDRDDGAAVAMMIVAELREHLARDEEGRLTVADALFGLGQVERERADLFERGSHCFSHSATTRG